MKVIISFCTNYKHLISKIVFGVSMIIALYYFIFQRGRIFIHSEHVWKNYKSIFSKNANSKNIDFHFFMFFPLLLAFGSNLVKRVDDGILNIIGVIASILMAMLYIFLQKIDSYTDEALEDQEITYLDTTTVRGFRNQTISLVMVELYVGILLLVLCFAVPMIGTIPILEADTVSEIIESIIQWLFSGWIFYLFYFFILNLLIVTKRFYTTVNDSVT